MSFAAPYLLITLLVVPLALVTYVVTAQRGRQAAMAAANPALWPNLMPRRPRFRRHVPPVLVALAIGLLLVGLARPQVALSTDQKTTTVVLTMDTSRSMAATDVKPSRIAAARSAAQSMLDKLPATATVGVVSFSREVHVLAAPTSDRAAVKVALNALKLGGGTAMGDGLDRALALLKATGTKGKGRAIVVISDGKTTEGKHAPLAVARAAKAAGVRIFSVSLGTAGGTITENGKPVSVPPDPTSLARLATISGGRAYTVSDASALQSAYRDIGSTVRPQRELRDISFVFLAAAAALVAASCALSLTWFRRLA